MAIKKQDIGYNTILISYKLIYKTNNRSLDEQIVNGDEVI